MYEEAEKSRKKYNENRITMIEKSLNQVIKRYEKISYKFFINICKE